jgi:hypothetical protein
LAGWLEWLPLPKEALNLYGTRWKQDRDFFPGATIFSLYTNFTPFVKEYVFSGLELAQIA